MKMNDNTKVSDILSYRKNEIKIVCKFQTLFELFQEQVTAKARELEENFNQEKDNKEVKLAQTSGNEL